jgi:hypothetical protein
MGQRDLVLFFKLFLCRITSLVKLVQYVSVFYGRGNLIVLISPYLCELNGF